MGAAREPSPTTWSAAGQDDVFGYWREVVCQAFTRLSPEKLTDGPFAGEIALSPLRDGASMSRIVASPQRVDRRRQDIAARPCDAVFVNVQVTGSSVVRQRGIETKLPAGSLALLDARQPFDMRFDEAFEQVCFHIPLSWLEPRDIDPARAIARPVDCARLVGKQFFNAILDADREGEEADNIEHLLQRLWLHYQDGAADTLADQHLQLVQRFVAENCTSAELSPGTVATRFRLSVRYIHKLFARSGVSFGQFLLRCRLERGFEALQSHPRRPIAEVAAAVGFKSASHFSRSFRRRYGQMPSAFREDKAILPDGVSGENLH